MYLAPQSPPSNPQDARRNQITLVADVTLSVVGGFIGVLLTASDECFVVQKSMGVCLILASSFSLLFALITIRSVEVSAPSESEIFYNFAPIV